MRLRNIYSDYLRKNLFVKVIFIFVVIVTLTIITLSYLLFNLLSASVVRSELNDQKQAMERVNRYMEMKYDWLQLTVQEIYRNNVLANNMSYFLTHPYSDYIQHMTDQNLAGGNENASDILNFFANRMELDPDIRNVILYSYEKQMMYVYQSLGPRKLIPVNATRSYIPDVMAAEGPAAGTPNVWVRKAIGQWNPQLYAMHGQLNDKNTLKNIGQLLVYFDAGLVNRALEQDRASLKGAILVLTPDGQVLSDSSNRYYGRVYPYMEQIGSLRSVEMLDEPSYISALPQNKAGYIVVGVAPTREIDAAYAGLRRTLMLIAIACIAVTILIPSLVIVNIARRTKRIVFLMKKVERGDLSARLHDAREDELGQISRGFNDMLDELVNHIDREYKSEIRLKRTELAALQARVNPHFLYNTLEVIRLRAISQGAKDVGEMIFSLATLFRHSVSSRPSNTLGEELEMCRLYLELFRIRYKNKFSYSIECPPELLGITVIKMLLQPIIENYIVHGVDSRRDDNRLSIEAVNDAGTVRVYVRDNGNGIEADKLSAILQALQSPDDEESGSFGLRSVHDRIRLAYGPTYGIHIESEQGNGTAVTVSWPAEEREAGEKDKDV
ncbi:sensor histidine kinase [Cohnella soli]|uniref:histidine kinase n=1 Tax=Cohnella soli TaxID=425005 RepID=A0ABW0HXM4_9BACL